MSVCVCMCVCTGHENKTVWKYNKICFDVIVNQNTSTTIINHDIYSHQSHQYNIMDSHLSNVGSALVYIQNTKIFDLTFKDTNY